MGPAFGAVLRDWVSQEGNLHCRVAFCAYYPAFIDFLLQPPTPTPAPAPLPPLTATYPEAQWAPTTCLLHAQYTSFACVNTHVLHVYQICRPLPAKQRCRAAAAMRNTLVHVYCMSSGCLQSGGGVQQPARRASCLRGLRGRCASSGWPASTPR